MKKFKLILLKGTFYLIALQILNLSIDIDYASFCSNVTEPPPDYDDIDSFTELIIEAIACDSNYIQEDGNDSDRGAAANNGVEKYSVDFLFFENFSKPQLFLPLQDRLSWWFAGLDQANKTCKGYFQIISPPPEAPKTC